MQPGGGDRRACDWDRKWDHDDCKRCKIVEKEIRDINIKDRRTTRDFAGLLAAVIKREELCGFPVRDRGNKR